jgi:hypothetical protein
LAIRHDKIDDIEPHSFEWAVAAVARRGPGAKYWR